MKALVIVPPLADFYFTRHRFSSLGGHIAAGLLSDAGIETTLLNFPLQQAGGTTIGLPAELGHLSPFIIPNEQGRLSFFTRYCRFGPALDRCADIVAQAGPDLCFFSLFAFCYADDAIELGRAIKERLPGVRNVIGGAGAAVFPEYFTDKGAFDLVLTGEAETTLPHLPAILQGRSPTPATPFAAPEEMVIPFVKTAESSHTLTCATSLSRGCPRGCDFCSSGLLFGRDLRTAPLASLERLLRERAPATLAAGKRVVVNFEDDNLLCDTGYLQAAMALFRRFLPGAEFVAENGLDYQLLDPSLCDRLIENGMRKFNLSLASTSPAILGNKGRSLDLDRYEAVIGHLAARGIPAVTYFICGFPEDTVETIGYSLRYLRDKKTTIGISPFYPVPGLKGFEDKSLFTARPSRLCCGSSMYPWNKSITTRTMVTAFRIARYFNLLKIPEEKRTGIENEAIRRIGAGRELYTIVKDKKEEERVVRVEGMDESLLERHI